MTRRFFNHLLLLCQFELKRLFSTRRGLLYLVTFAIVWYFILFYPIRYASGLLEHGHDSTQMTRFFEYFGFGSLLNWHIPEFGVYWRFALLLFPMLSVMIASDQTCSDRERGTLRFLAMRVSRNGIFFGRFTAAMVIQTILVIVSLLTTLVLARYRDSNLWAEAFNGMLVIMVNLLIVLLPFTALMATLSASVKSSRQATTWAVLIWTFMSGIISGLASYLPALSSLKFLIPGYQMSTLAQLSEWETLQLAHIPLLQTIVLLSLGSWIMSKQTL